MPFSEDPGADVHQQDGHARARSTGPHERGRKCAADPLLRYELADRDGKRVSGGCRSSDRRVHLFFQNIGGRRSESGDNQAADGQRRGKKKSSQSAHQKLQEELDLLGAAGNAFSQEEFLEGKVTPVFFASALTNFGVEPFFDAFIHLAPCPHARLANKLDGTEIEIDPVTTPFSGYVFKLQANMDRRHRDSMAFIRICSGRFEKDLVVKNHRLKKEIRSIAAAKMVAGERTTLDFAYPGDIIGVINPSLFAIGDTISLTGGFNYKPLPLFQPEIFAKIHPKDVGKRKGV